MCLNTGTPKNINFSLETNGKLMALGVPILKHFRVQKKKIDERCHGIIRSCYKVPLSLCFTWSIDLSLNLSKHEYRSTLIRAKNENKCICKQH